MVKLNVPYRSQWDNDANTHNADCGPTCVAMILNFNDVDITPNEVYDFIPPKDTFAFTNFSELIKATRQNNVAMDYCPPNRVPYQDQNDAFNHLRSNLDAGNPIIALVNYKHWKESLGNDFEGGHFVVVTGYDDQNIYFHDPLFGLWVKPREKGAHVTMTYAAFAAGWGGFPANENPNWACTVAGPAAAPAPVAPTPAKPPSPPPTAPPATPVTPTPVVPDGQAKTMPDVNLRIRALAAYRWAEQPDFDNPAEVQLWMDHLGDWGWQYDEHVVRAGDTLAGVAARVYGEQHRWHAIQTYNDLQRDGLWLGETLLIPRLGQSGAHIDPALPHDTTDFAKSLELGMLVDPDLPAQDYNALSAKTVGIGFVDL